MYRYERKFRLSNNYYHAVKNQIELQGWFKQYPDREVNNIYFDSLSNDSYDESINGHLEKKKYRVRWYGETFPKNSQVINSAILEIKIKREMLNYKKAYDFGNFILSKKTTYNDLLSILSDKIKNNINDLDLLYIENIEPIFINNYSREYFIDLSGKIRLTIDRRQKYYNINPYIFRQEPIDDIVIEIKFPSNVSYNNFVIKTNLIQNSKFTTGIEQYFK